MRTARTSWGRYPMLEYSPGSPALGSLLRGSGRFHRLYVFLRRLHSLRIDHRTVEFDNDGVDVVDAIVDFHGLFRTQHERGFGQSIGARGIRADNGGAAHLAGGMAGMRIDDVMITHAVFVEESFVIA